MKLGLCLSGGGVKGAAHIGVIKALEEEGIDFEYISGTSSGSIVAVLYSIGYTPDEMLELFKTYGKKVKNIEFLKILKLILGVIFRRELIIDGLNSGNRIEKIVDKSCRVRNITDIEQIEKHLIIPTVDIYSGELLVFNSDKIDIENGKIRYIPSGDIGKIVRASCSYPLVFAPCDYENTKLIDGGIKENVPWKETKRIGADKVLSIIFETTKKKCCNNVVEIASRSLDLICEELADYELEGADYLLKIKLENVSLLDTDKIDEIYKEGYYQAKRQMKKLKDFCLN